MKLFIYRWRNLEDLNGRENVAIAVTKSREGKEGADALLKEREKGKDLALLLGDDGSEYLVCLFLRVEEYELVEGLVIINNSVFKP